MNIIANAMRTVCTKSRPWPTGSHLEAKQLIPHSLRVTLSVLSSLDTRLTAMQEQHALR